MNSIIESFNHDFDRRLSSSLCKQVLTGIEAFQVLLRDNVDFFSYPEFSSVRGTLLRYSIEHCLYKSAFTADSLYKVSQRKVNNFNCSVLNLQTENFLITAAKTMKWDTLPHASKYKKQYALANTGASGQLTFDFLNQTVATPPYYALLTYGYNSRAGECSHIRLIVPDSDFSQFIHQKDILAEKHSLVAVPTKSDIEETVAKLKPAFEQQVVRLKTK